MMDRFCSKCKDNTYEPKGIFCSKCKHVHIYCPECFESDTGCVRCDERETKKRTREDITESPKNAVVEFTGCRGRTGPQRPKIQFDISHVDDNLIKIRIDDTENPEFWIEGFVLKKQPSNFLLNK